VRCSSRAGSSRAVLHGRRAGAGLVVGQLAQVEPKVSGAAVAGHAALVDPTPQRPGRAARPHPRDLQVDDDRSTHHGAIVRCAGTG
jgi:hypothetical protein